MKQQKNIVILCSIVMLLLPSITIGIATNNDLDPLVDLKITVDITKIRSLEKDDPQVHAKEIIDQNNNPDFYVKVFIDNNEFTSDTFWNTKYLYDPDLSFTYNIDDSQQH